MNKGSHRGEVDSETEETKEAGLVLDGEGQVTFKFTAEGLNIELFQQDSMNETIDFEEVRKLINWFSLKDMVCSYGSEWVIKKVKELEE